MAGAETVSFDFENGNDHGFSLWSAYIASPALDDPNIAGDELVTGVGGAVCLPDFGVAWAIGPPNQYDGLAPVVEEGCHVVDGVLEYSSCNDPFGVFDTDPPSYINSRGQSGYLNTYNLNQWGDSLNSAINDQIATSSAILLGEGSVLTVWTQGGGSGTHAPEYDTDSLQLYTDGSAGIAVLSAEPDDLFALLASIHTQGQGTLTEDTLDLSAFAGKSVFIEVVDAFDGAWGWLVVDEIQITNAAVLGISWDFENGNNHGFILSCLNPATPAADNPDIAGDEVLTGVVDIENPVDTGLPNAGLAWTIGTPGDFEGLLPAFAEGCHIEDTPGGVMQYGPCNDPFSRASGDLPYDFTNNRGQSGYLNTYALSQWGDDLHIAENDQIATSPVVALYGEAELTVWAYGNTAESWAAVDGKERGAPELEADAAAGYVSNTGGIAVLSAEDGSLLTGLFMPAEGGDWGGTPGEFTLDLSAFAGQQVIIEVVDAFAGGWGWMAVDEIQITNAALVGPEIPEPIADFPMDEGAGTLVADVVGGNDGTMVGLDPAAAWITDGASGGAVRFDNIEGHHIEVPHADVLDFGDVDFSISLWVRYLTPWPDGEEDMWIVKGTSSAPGTGNRYELFIDSTSDLRFSIDNDAVGKTVVEVPSASIYTGEWVHVVAVRDAGNDLLSAYADNVLLGTNTDGSGDIASGEPLWIGESLSGSMIMSGDIDDIRIFDAALTEEQIGAIY
jgi:hypothetical protein